jgi:hypothetical protein
MADVTAAPKAADKKDDKKEPKRVRVMAPNGRRVLFEGNEKDSREYVQNNYPRVHVEPGNVYGDDGPPADVHLDIDGDQEYWNGSEWTEVEK